MSRVVLCSEVNDKDKRILRMRDGQIPEGTARELGLLLFSSKDGSETYWFYYHPRNVVTLDTMRAAFSAKGLRLEIRTVDPATSKDISPLMLPRDVSALSSEFVQAFESEGGHQMSPALDRLRDKLIAAYHPRLASAAILHVIEDFDPAEMAQKLYKGVGQKEVAAFAKKTSGPFSVATGYDFTITVCESIWKMLDKESKRYLFDHELMHCGRNDKGRWELWEHDQQLFSEEILRYGNRISSLRRSIERITEMAKVGKAGSEDAKNTNGTKKVAKKAKTGKGTPQEDSEE